MCLHVFIICSSPQANMPSAQTRHGSVPSLSHIQLFDPMDCSLPGLPVHHQLQELGQTHVHQVSDAIQPSHPLSSPSPPAFNLSQHQGLGLGNVGSQQPPVQRSLCPAYWQVTTTYSSRVESRLLQRFCVFQQFSL